MGRKDGFTLNQQKELLSLATTTVVCASSGCTWSRDVYDTGIDLRIIGASWEFQPQIDIQLKSTADFSMIKSGAIKYPLAARNYNDLVGPNQVDRLLVLMLLPDDPETWAKQTQYQISLQYGLFWVSLKEMAPTTNVSSVTITIPLENRFDSTMLKAMMAQINSDGGSRL